MYLTILALRLHLNPTMSKKASSQIQGLLSTLFRAQIVTLIISYSAVSLAGGSDGGGGGLLYYRTARAVELARLIVNQVSPKDVKQSLVELYGNESNPYFEHYSKSRKDLAALLSKLSVKVVSSKALTFGSSSYPVWRSHLIDPKESKLYVAEFFYDLTLANKNPASADDVIQNVLAEAFTALGKELYISDYNARELSSALIRISKSKPVGQSSYRGRYYQFSNRLNLTYAQFQEIKKNRWQKVETFKDRLNQVQQIAITMLSSLKSSELSQLSTKSQKLLTEQRGRLLSTLDQVQVDTQLKYDKGMNEFYNRHGHFSSGGKITFTQALRHASLDELLFMVLHEVGHSLRLYEEAYVLENTINELAWDLVQYIQKNNNTVAVRFEDDRKKSPLSYDEVLNAPEDITIRVTDIAVNGLPFLGVPPRPSSSFQEEYNGKVHVPSRRALLLCRWLGFKSNMNYIIAPPWSSTFKANVLSEDGTIQPQTFIVKKDEAAGISDSAECENRPAEAYREGFTYAGE